MQLLAIKSEEGKGVYLVKDKKDKQELVKKYQGCSHRIFEEKEKEEALKWANVKEISNRPQQVVNTTSLVKTKNDDSFLETLEYFRNLGYTHVELSLTSGKTHLFWLNTFRYIILRNCFYITCSRKNDFYQDGKLQFFDDFKIKFENSLKEYNEYWLNRNNNITLDVAFSNLIQYLKKEKCSFFKTIIKPNIITNKEYIIIKHTFQQINYKQLKISEYNPQIYIEIVDEINQQDDVAINRNHITNITPLKLEKIIVDKTYNDMIDELIKNGIINFDGTYN